MRHVLELLGMLDDASWHRSSGGQLAVLALCTRKQLRYNVNWIGVRGSKYSYTYKSPRITT